MIKLPEKRDVLRLRGFFDESGYSDSGLRESFETSYPPTEGQMQSMLHLTRDQTPLNALTRLFLIGASLEHEIAGQVLPDWLLSICFQNGLLERDDRQVQPLVVIVPVEDFLFVSTAFRLLGTNEAAEFVPPASTHSANFLRHLCLRSPCKNMLDLGSGCGIQGLFAAAHCQRVVASDISPIATRFTEFNALFNGCENIDCVTGDLFAPVDQQRFDLIVSNPPFVIGPGQEFVYRDNEMELDEFCRQLVQEAPIYLEENGYFQMLCEWVEIDGEPWRERLAGWFRGTGCDAWVLRSPPRSPSVYVTLRLSDISGPDVPGSDKHADWIAYLESRSVRAVHPGMILLRRRAGRNWFHVHDVASDVANPAGEAVLRGIEACDFLDRCGSDESLLNSTLRLAPQISLEHRFSRADNQWQPDRSLLRLTDGLPMDTEIDPPVMAFLNGFDGVTTTRDCIERFATATSADVAKLTEEFLSIVRMFIQRGFLQPANEAE